MPPRRLINLRLRDGDAADRARGSHPSTVALLREFGVANRTLWRDGGGGRCRWPITTLFWGAGAVLQFAVLRWATIVSACR